VLPLPAIVRRRLAVVPAFVWVASVAVVGAAGGARVGWVDAMAASPDRIREGKVWFLFSSAGLVDHPVVISVLSFAALAGLAWLTSGARVFWLSAFLGQIAATLLVYLFIGAARQLVAGAFSAAISSPDYGVSTVSAAWLGSIATVSWRRRGRSLRGKAAVALGCVAVALFAYSVRPDLTVLSSEHLVAFALGVGAAIPGLLPGAFAHIVKVPVERSASALTRLAGREVSRAAVAIALTTAFATFAVVAAPAALGTLRQEIALHLQPTMSRCVSDWNRLADAPRSLAQEQPFTQVSVRLAHIRSGGQTVPHATKIRRSVTYCRYAFVSRRRTLLVLGRWRHGTVTDWIVERAPGLHPVRSSDASLETRGRIHVMRRPDHRPGLSS
jgi:hypothetical protein